MKLTLLYEFKKTLFIDFSNSVFLFELQDLVLSMGVNKDNHYQALIRQKLGNISRPVATTP